MLPSNQGLEVILLEDPNGWPLEKPPKHLYRLFPQKEKEVTHQLGHRKQGDAKMGKKVKKRHGNKRVQASRKPEA